MKKERNKNPIQPVSGTKVPRFAGPNTFARLPELRDVESCDVAIVGIPFDAGTSYRPGARFGPQSIRQASRHLRTNYHPNYDVEPFKIQQVADAGDIACNPFSIDEAIKQIEVGATDLLNKVGGIISLGGDHTIAVPLLRAINKKNKGPVSLVHFDAHCDTGDDYLGSKFHHGAPFRRAVEEGLLDPQRTIQIGIRGPLNDPDVWKFSEDSGMRVVSIEEFYDSGWRAVMAEARIVVGEGPTYISFDVDGLDPVYAPGTGTPEVGGFTTHEAQQMIRSLRGLQLYGGDVVEVAPPFDPSGTTALVGASIMFEILCVVSESVASRK